MPGKKASVSAYPVARGTGIRMQIARDDCADWPHELTGRAEGATSLPTR